MTMNCILERLGGHRGCEDHPQYLLIGAPMNAGINPCLPSCSLSVNGTESLLEVNLLLGP